jgi:hypothetical protein
MIGKKINQLATELAPVSTDLTIIGDPISGVSKKITLAQLGAIFSGAVSFYDDLASFPATGDINVIYCAKDTKKLYLWSGSAYVEVFPSQALLDTYQLRSEKGNANGYASLDSGGKVPVSQLPSSIMEYKGMWNAATNTPTLANGTGDTGDVYICNVAGTVNFGAGAITFAVGDYVIYSGSIWQRSSGAVGTVTSVAASITGDSITISNSPISTSGTLAFAFAGTSAQYINGAGNLTTFPSLTGYVPYTGATSNVDLGTHTLSAKDLVINHSSGSGVAASITKGGNGEALTVVKSSGSGNAASITGGVTLLDELHLNTDLADTYIASASNWNAAYNDKINSAAVTGTTTKTLTLTQQDGGTITASWTDDNTDAVTSVFGRTGAVVATSGDYNTSQVTENTNLYYTEARVNANTNVAANTAARHNAVTLGTANGLSLSTQVLSLALASGSTTGALSSTDWTTFNNKQSALTNPVTGTGTTNYLPKFTGTSTIGNSAITDDGTTVSLLSRALSGTSASFISTAKVLEVKQSAAGSATYYVFDNTVEATGKKWRFGYTGAVADAGTFSLYNETDNVVNFVAKGGNLGLGVTPSAWGAAFKVLQIDGITSLYTESSIATKLTNNVYFSDANRYYASGLGATQYTQQFGSHQWSTAPSGTAGNAISFTQAMTLDASGRLIVGATTPIYLKFNVSETSTNRVAILYRGTQAADSSMITTFGTPYLSIGGQENKVDSIQTIGFGFTNGTSYIQPAEIGFQTTSISGYTLGDLVFATRGATTNTAPDVRLRIASTGAATFSSVVQSNANFISNITTDTISVGTTAANNATYNYTGFSGYWGIRTTTTGFNFALDTYNGGTPKNVLTITQAGAATFSSSVSIGGADQGYQLDVKRTSTGDSTFDTVANFYKASTHNTGLLLRLKNTIVDLAANNITGGGGPSAGMSFSVSSGGTISTALTLASTGAGNVGIGTSSPVSKLDILGANEVMNIAGTNATSAYTGGNLEIATGSIKTGEPDTGYGRAAVKIGARNTGEAFTSAGYIPVNIDGTVYFINLYSDLP